MTDFLCEPASLNEWIAGIDGNKDTPKSFNEEAPAVQLASRGDITAHAGILEAAKAVVKDLQVSYFSLYCCYTTSTLKRIEQNVNVVIKSIQRFVSICEVKSMPTRIETLKACLDFLRQFFLSTQVDRLILQLFSWSCLNNHLPGTCFAVLLWRKSCNFKSLVLFTSVRRPAFWLCPCFQYSSFCYDVNNES